MRKIATTAAALALAASPNAAAAATYVGFAPASAGYAGANDPILRPPVVDELVDYAVTTLETFPSVGGRIGEALSASRAVRIGRPVLHDQGRYLSNFRIPPGARLTRARPSTADEGATDVPTMAMVPEPATWTMMILGFGLVAGARRRRRMRPSRA